MMHYSLAYPYISYCITTWGGALKTTLKPIVTLQKKIIKLMTFSDMRDPTTPLFSKLKILKFKDIYNLHLALLFHKTYNGKTIGSNSLINIQNIHNYNTRLSASINFYQSHNRTNLGQSTYTNAGTKFWRTLPREIKTKTYPAFKSKVKDILINSYL